jgi:ABC-type polysaccharide/polyol phosphate export permease
MHTNYAPAFRDLLSGALNWSMWSRLALSDIKGRYRRTVLGPLWSTVSLGIVILAMGLVMARLFNSDIKQFMPYLTSGMITWTFVSSILTEGSLVFVNSESLIKSIRFPISTLVFALVCRNLIVFVHNLIIFAIVALVVGMSVTTATLLIIPGLVIVCLTGVSAGTLLGMAGARFRDISPVVTASLQIIIFVTPIFWSAEQIKGKVGLILTDFNVFYHFVNIVREPLLGRAPSATSWIITLAICVFAWVITMTLFARFHRRIAYWL